MRITLTTAGTRGDTQPLAMLALELQRRGHDPVLGVSPNTVDLCRRLGLPARGVGPDSQALMESDRGRAWLAAGNVTTFMKELTALSAEHAAQTRAELRAVSEGADLHVSGVLMQDYADPMAEAQGVPLVALHSFPVTRQRLLPHPLVTTRRLPAPLNRLTCTAFDTVWWRGTRVDVNELRDELGLAPTTASPVARSGSHAGRPAVQMYDRALVPGLAEEYGDHRPLVGFLAPDAELRELLGERDLPDSLRSWLDEGDPPVFFGFGSMPVRDPAAAVAMLVDVSHRLGVRAVVNAGWAQLEALDPDDEQVFVVGPVDHDQLLARCRVAVHHGGAGTTFASLSAGVPTVVCSVFADQPFWGSRIERLGIGSTLRFADLDADRLEAAVRRALAPEVTARAAALAGTLRSSGDAVARAADVVEAAA